MTALPGYVMLGPRSPCAKLRQKERYWSQSGLSKPNAPLKNAIKFLTWSALLGALNRVRSPWIGSPGMARGNPPVDADRDDEGQEVEEGLAGEVAGHEL